MKISERTTRWMAFADLNSRVNRMMVINCAEGMPQTPHLWWSHAQERVEWSYARYEKQCENMAWLEDDTVPSLSVITGTEIFAEAFGCRVHYPEDSNPFALPLVANAAEAARLRAPKLEDTKLVTLFDIADRLKAKAGPDALLGLPDIQSPFDVAALIWDKNDFYPAMIEEPEAVLALANQVKMFQFAFLDAWFDRYGAATMAHYPDYYIPRGVTMSIDEIGVINPSMFETFVAPELAAFSARYGALGLHCCADSTHQWQRMCNLQNVYLLNLVRDEAESVRSCEVFQDAYALFNNTYVSHPGAADREKLHIGFNLYAETKDDALRLLERYNRDWQ